MESRPPLPSAPPSFDNAPDEEVEEEECAVCLLPYQAPRTLPDCGHTFCSPCLRAILKDHDPAHCPLCRAIIPRGIVELGPPSHDSSASLEIDDFVDLGLPVADEENNQQDSAEAAFTKHSQPSLLSRIKGRIVPSHARQLSNSEREDGMCWGGAFEVEADEVPLIVREWLSSCWLLPGDLNIANVEIEDVRQVFLPFYAYDIRTYSEYIGTASIRETSRRSNREISRRINLPGMTLESKYRYTVLAVTPETQHLQGLTQEMLLDSSQWILLPANSIPSDEIPSPSRVFESSVRQQVLDAEHSRAVSAVRRRCGVRAQVLSCDAQSMTTESEFEQSLVCLPFYEAKFIYVSSSGQRESFTVLINGISGMCVGVRPYGVGVLARFGSMAYEQIAAAGRSVGEWFGFYRASPEPSAPPSHANDNNAPY